MKHFTLAAFLMVLCSLIGPHKASGQTVVKGDVMDANSKEPLIGASIIIKGTGQGTVTDFDGAFVLKIKGMLPVTIVFSYIGYLDHEMEITSSGNFKVKLEEDVVTIDAGVEVVGQRVSEKQKSSPLTVESLDLVAIRETPSDNFYDGLGSLKGVDLTAASLGFKIINTRGFNSTSPVRSLQIIDGVDNQAPGLNFSLGNFLGSSDLDVVKVDLIVGASSAFYGPNAFNGVISMETKDPFFQKGLSASVKGGERNLFETAIRWADAFKNKDGEEYFGYKVNLSYLRADDWEADNFDPVYDTKTDQTNPGRYDAVNTYGDEYQGNFDLTTAGLFSDFKGIGEFHRTGYQEQDVVDYNTRNFKSNVAFHFRLNPSQRGKSPELIAATSFSRGTTVYQGDNRFSLKNISFVQSRLEFRQRDKFFLRAYLTRDDAGDSYDPYFTSLLLQRRAKNNADWGKDYVNYWRLNIAPQMDELGYPQLEVVVDPETGAVSTLFDKEGAMQWLAEHKDLLDQWHEEARNIADKAGTGVSVPFFEPGTERFQKEFDRIRNAKSNRKELGTKFFDKSALYHIQGEYKFKPKFAEKITVGGNARFYRPRSDGTIFFDTLSQHVTALPNGTNDTTFTSNRITNSEFGLYAGISKKFAGDRLTASATLRVDKNQNFRWLGSPAASLVWKPRPNNYFRLSFSSAIRNPTLTDQYLFLNVGPAILAGNLNGVQGLLSLESFDCYRGSLDANCLETFDIAPVKPEKVKTVEVGYRTTLFNSLYMDASYYFSVYNDFLGFNIGIDAEFGAGGIPTKLDVFRYAANSINTVTTQGFSIGLNYYFGDYFMLKGNYSWNKLNKTFADDPIIPAFNTPEHKFNIGISGRNIQTSVFKNFGFNINFKWIKGFLFEGSPQFTGFIPSYSLLDAQVNYKIPRLDLTFKVGASNLLDKESFQAYGGPRIGRLAYTSLVYEFKKK